MKSNAAPLIVILVGTTLLAIPSSFVTFLLFIDPGGSPRFLNESMSSYLIALSLTGFGLYFGYILTAFSGRHNFWFWTISALYNLVIASCSSVALLSTMFTERFFISESTLFWLVFTGYLFFVTWASIQYAKGARRLARLKKSLL